MFRIFKKKKAVAKPTPVSPALVERLLLHCICQVFIDFKCQEFYMSLAEIHDEFFAKQYPRELIVRVLENELCIQKLVQAKVYWYASRQPIVNGAIKETIPVRVRSVGRPYIFH